MKILPAKCNLPMLVPLVYTVESLRLVYFSMLEGCIQSLDWTELDWTTGLPLEVKIQHYNGILAYLFTYACETRSVINLAYY